MLKFGMVGFGTLAVTLFAGASAAEDLDRILTDGTMVVATEAAFKPFEYVEDGEIVGLGAAILAAIAADLGVEVEQLDLPFQGILAGLAAGQYDMVATSVAITPERAETYAFTRPIAAIENVVVTLVDGPEISALEDLNGLHLGTQLGSSTEAVAREINETLTANGGGVSDLRLFQTFPDTAFALRSGQIDAILVGNTTAGEFMAASPDTFEVDFTYGDPVFISWVLRPGNPELMARVNGVIGDLVDSGEMASLHEEWVGTVMPTPSENYLPEGAVQ